MDPQVINTLKIVEIILFLILSSGVGAHEKWGGPVASLMISGGVSRPIGHRTNIVCVKKWGDQSPPKSPCSDAYDSLYHILCIGTIRISVLYTEEIQTV